MTERPEDEIAVVDRSFLEMVRASLHRGYLCSHCKATVRQEDVVRLLGYAEQQMERADITRLAVAAFAEALCDRLGPLPELDPLLATEALT